MPTDHANKGHYSLDTVERENEYERRRGHGWEDEYRWYRSEWVRRPQERDPGPWPLNIDLEISTLCNLNCPMCYRASETFKQKVKPGFMSLRLIKKIIDEMADHVPALRLLAAGESIIHPDFLEIVKYAKENGVKEVSIVTNGAALTRDFIRQLVEVDIDWISVSIDGLDKTYEEIRFPLKFGDTYQKLADLMYYRDKLNKQRPVIKVQSIWPAIENCYEEWLQVLTPVTDLLAFHSYTDYTKTPANFVYDNSFACPDLYQRIYIAIDGKANACCGDIYCQLEVGDITKNSIKEIWNGEKVNKIRRLHESPGGFLQLPVCAQCHVGIKLNYEIKEMSDHRQFKVGKFEYK